MSGHSAVLWELALWRCEFRGRYSRPGLGRRRAVGSRWRRNGFIPLCSERVLQYFGWGFLSKGSGAEALADGAFGWCLDPRKLGAAAQRRARSTCENGRGSANWGGTASIGLSLDSHPDLSATSPEAFQPWSSLMDHPRTCTNSRSFSSRILADQVPRAQALRSSLEEKWNYGDGGLVVTEHKKT